LPIIAAVQSVESFTPVRSLGTAIVLSGVNPKNLLLTLGAAAAIAQAGSAAAGDIGQVKPPRTSTTW
jgi:hypothetical protein